MALRTGQVRRPEACEDCGATEYRPHAHHDDYWKALEVRWLCPGCHKRHHMLHGPGLGIEELVDLLVSNV